MTDARVLQDFFAEPNQEQIKKHQDDGHYYAAHWIILRQARRWLSPQRREKCGDGSRNQTTRVVFQLLSTTLFERFGNAKRPD